MAIHRLDKREEFTVVSNAILKDKMLSLKSKAMLITMLSLSDDWKFSVSGLSAITGEGKTAVRACLSELEKAGYLIRKKSTNKNGQFDYEYDVYESPCTGLPHTDEPHTDEPHTDEPHTDEPHTENRDAYKITNNKILNNKRTNNKRINIKGENASQRFIPPTLDEVREYCSERNNSVDPEKFIDYYTANGWKVGRNKMKDWKASVRTWERNDFNSGKKEQKKYGANGIEIDQDMREQDKEFESLFYSTEWNDKE